ncbi:MAG: hypothetical protein ACRC7B_01735 [Metamycoplasmataceae bacterium]
MMYCNSCKEIETPKYSQEQLIISLMLFIFFCVFGLLYFLFIKKNTCPYCYSKMIMINGLFENRSQFEKNDHTENNNANNSLDSEK